MQNGLCKLFFSEKVTFKLPKTRTEKNRGEFFCRTCRLANRLNKYVDITSWSGLKIRLLSLIWKCVNTNFSEFNVNTNFSEFNTWQFWVTAICAEPSGHYLRSKEGDPMLPAAVCCETTTTVKHAKYRVLNFRLMACVTLKRSLELEPLYSPTGNSAKRRRCAPLTPLFARNDQSHGERQMARKIQHSSTGATKLVEARRVFGDNGSQSPQSGASGAFSPLPMPSNGSLLRFHLRPIEIRFSGSILFRPPA